MGREVKCKICGSVFLSIAIANIIINNVCGSCRKRIEENPDFTENRKVVYLEKFYASGLDSTTTISGSSFSINIQNNFRQGI